MYLVVCVLIIAAAVIIINDSNNKTRERLAGEYNKNYERQLEQYVDRTAKIDMYCPEKVEPPGAD